MSAKPEQYMLAAWKLPLIVAAIAFSIVVGFYAGGPGLGMAVGALAASSVIVMAIRNPPKATIVPPAASDERGRLLLLVDGATGFAAVTAFALAATAEAGAGALEVLAVVPLRQRPLDRWTGDIAEARKLAEGRLAMVLAALRRAGVRASGCLGDEVPVQAAEDALRRFPATRVAMIAPGEPAAAAAELMARLSVPFAYVRGGTGAAADERAVAGRGSSPAPIPLTPQQRRDIRPSGVVGRQAGGRRL